MTLDAKRFLLPRVRRFPSSPPPTAYLRSLIRAGIFVACVAATLFRGPADEPGKFRFHHDNILGTSLDLQVACDDAQLAGTVDTAILDEIERLRKILSTYDPASEISKLNTTNAPMVCSQDLIDVLTFYDWWTAKSGGAYNGHLGELIQVWKAAETAGTPPDAATLKQIVATLAQPGWAIDPKAKTVQRLTPQPLNVNSLGKGYIISKAIVAARAKAPAARGILLNIGGDIYASGVQSPGTPWLISVTDSMHSADNAPPLTQVRLNDHAVSTSAAYERGYTIGGKRYSHIFDPRTGLPAAGIASATVIAGNSANSNAMATMLCVLRPEEGLALVKQIAGAECLLVTADGRQLRSAHFASYEVQQPVAATPPPAPQAPAQAAAPAAPGMWPSGYMVTLGITLKPPTHYSIDVSRVRNKDRNPYVAAWVEDANGKRVRTIAVWGNNKKFVPDLSEWWKVSKLDAAWAATVTRATRQPGHYKLEWDGTDDKNNPLPAGTYTIYLEVNREFGDHKTQSGKIVCGTTASQGTIPASTEADATDLAYGPAAPGQ